MGDDPRKQERERIGEENPSQGALSKSLPLAVGHVPCPGHQRTTEKSSKNCLCDGQEDGQLSNTFSPPLVEGCPCWGHWLLHTSRLSLADAQTHKAPEKVLGSKQKASRSNVR